MKICIYGAGAVGGNFAARLANAGHDISIVARGATLAAIRERGITIESGDERIVARVAASDRPGDLGRQDVVISTLKANGLPALAAGVGPLLGADTSIVFAQNGIPWWYALQPGAPDLSLLDPGGLLARTIEARRIVAGVVYSANTVVAPGVIRNAPPNRIVVAHIDDTPSAFLDSLRQAFGAAGIPSPSTDSIRREIWQKLASNLVTGMTILVDEPTSAMMADPHMRAVAARLVDETVAIAAAFGISVQKSLPSVPPGKKASILVDYEDKRTMEVEAQFLAPLAFARAAGIAAPTLEAVAATIAHKAAAQGSFTR